MSDRVYRPALPLEEATSIMREGRGTHFDPEVLDTFLASLDTVLGIDDDGSAGPGVEGAAASKRAA